MAATGGTDTVLIGDVIERQFKQGSNPNLGAALSLLLLILPPVLALRKKEDAAC